MASRRPHLLVLDADPQSQGVICAALEAAGYACLCFDDPLRALERLAAGEVDLVVADQSLPVMAGGQVVEAARSRGRPLPAVLIGDAAGARVGGTERLTRPVDPRMLIAAIDRLLGRSTGRRPRG